MTKQHLSQYHHSLSSSSPSLLGVLGPEKQNSGKTNMAFLEGEGKESKNIRDSYHDRRDTVHSTLYVLARRNGNRACTYLTILFSIIPYTILLNLIASHEIACSSLWHVSQAIPILSSLGTLAVSLAWHGMLHLVFVGYLNHDHGHCLQSPPLSPLISFVLLFRSPLFSRHRF